MNWMCLLSWSHYFWVSPQKVRMKWTNAQVYTCHISGTTGDRVRLYHFQMVGGNTLECSPTLKTKHLLVHRRLHIREAELLPAVLVFYWEVAFYMVELLRNIVSSHLLSEMVQAIHSTTLFCCICMTQPHCCKGDLCVCFLLPPWISRFVRWCLHAFYTEWELGLRYRRYGNVFPHHPSSPIYFTWKDRTLHSFMGKLSPLLLWKALRCYTHFPNFS